MGFLLSKLLPLLVYPLGLGLLLHLSALVASRRDRKQLSYGLSGAGIGVIWLLAMPITSRQLLWGLEEQAVRLTPTALPTADAVVVLGGGLRPALPPRQGVEVAEGGDRLLTGLRLMRQGKAPHLVTSGGQVHFTAADPSPPEAVSAQLLAEELGLPAQQIITNAGSRTTAEEARDIGVLAQARGWHQVLLVTSAFHMPRAMASFERSGLRVIPVACDFQLPERRAFGKPTVGSVVQDLLPNAESLHQSTIALKEHLGSVLYRLKGWA